MPDRTLITEQVACLHKGSPESDFVEAYRDTHSFGQRAHSNSDRAFYGMALRKIAAVDKERDGGVK